MNYYILRHFIILLFFLLLIRYQGFSQQKKLVSDSCTAQTDTISLLFIGDIMQHDAQIEAAYDRQTKTYHYDGYFDSLRPIFDDADFTIANLELTFAGKPYQGYPTFSAPDELGIEIKESGIHHLVTANNHTVDHDKEGLERTLYILERLGFTFTGTFKDSVDRLFRHPMVLEKNDVKVAIFNYTYGTNGREIEHPNIVNLIDTNLIKQDLVASNCEQYDARIVFFHWGNEYKKLPSKKQKKIAKMCLEHGADFIIGTHPHVLQPVEYFTFTDTNQVQKETIIVYSMGNFVSNYVSRYKDGGIMFRIDFTKKQNRITVVRAGYYLVWVNKPVMNSRKKYQVLPCSYFEHHRNHLSTSAYKKMKRFVDDSRDFFRENNKNIGEFIYNPESNQWEYTKKTFIAVE